MRRALALARRGLGHTYPNPPVGAVVVSDGRLVGEGFHLRAGEAHAEIAALRQAGERARGAELFVTLEPCNHHGKTPPCVPAIVEAGITRVHVAAPDPNRRSGGGLQALAEAGIEVALGAERRVAEHLIAGFASRIHRGRPRISLKVAASLDGKIAAGSGDAKWISSEVARAWVHRRRREAGVIVVGAETALQDNPALTVRSVAGRSPDRVVLDSTLRVPASARVWKDDGTRRIAATTAAADPTRRRQLEEAGVEVWVLPGDARGRVDLAAWAHRLGEEHYNDAFLEGGGRLAGACLAAKLVDQVWLVVSRHLLLGGSGPGWTEGLAVDKVTGALQIARSEVRELGPDWLFTLVPQSAQWWDPETHRV